MSEIHELFVLALSLVWFAGATPESSEAAAGLAPKHFSSLSDPAEKSNNHAFNAGTHRTKKVSVCVCLSMAHLAPSLASQTTCRSFFGMIPLVCTQATA